VGSDEGADVAGSHGVRCFGQGGARDMPGGYLFRSGSGHQQQGKNGLYLSRDVTLSYYVFGRRGQWMQNGG